MRSGSFACSGSRSGAVTVPVSSEPGAAGSVAIGDAAVSVLVVGSAPVFVSVSTVTATFSWVMNLQGNDHRQRASVSANSHARSAPPFVPGRLGTVRPNVSAHGLAVKLIVGT